jgi:hypothetical protein
MTLAAISTGLRLDLGILERMERLNASRLEASNMAATCSAFTRTGGRACVAVADDDEDDEHDAGYYETYTRPCTWCLSHTIRSCQSPEV